jgi:hypothetical protein
MEIVEASDDESEESARNFDMGRSCEKSGTFCARSVDMVVVEIGLTSLHIL